MSTGPRLGAGVPPGGDELVVAVDDARAPDVADLVDRHLAFARAVTPPGHVHAVAADGLSDPAVTVVGARRRGVLLGVGALRHLDGTHAELKSMHTAAPARGQGVGRAVVRALLRLAAERGYRRVSLETGTQEAFAPARSLYRALGFTPCAPFGSYRASAHSVCMTVAVDGAPPHPGSGGGGDSGKRSGTEDAGGPAHRP